MTGGKITMGNIPDLRPGSSALTYQSYDKPVGECVERAVPVLQTLCP